jgi:O-antigen/teichoic acid export membrane protein
MALIVAIIAPYLATHTINAPHLVLEVRLGCLLLLFNAINGAQNGALSGLEAFKSVAKMNLYRGLINFPVVVGGVILWGLPGAVLGSVITAGAGCVFGFVLLRRDCQAYGIVISYRGWRSESSVLWRFSLPALVSSAMFGPVEWLLSAILVNQSNGYSEMGLFSAARQWFVIILYLPAAISQISSPMLANLWGENQLERYRRVLIVNTLLLTGSAAAIAIPVAIASPWVMSVYGPSFSGGWLVLVVMCGYSMMWASNIVVGQAIWASGKSLAGMLFATLRAIVLLVTFLLLRRHGALGLSLSFAISHIALTVYQFPYMLSILKRQAHVCGTQPNPLEVQVVE